MDLERYRSLKFELLREEDIPQLHAWLHKPHVREFYHKKPVPGWAEFLAEYRQRLDAGWATKCFLIYAGTVALGYIQAYKVADYPDYAVLIQEQRGISLDLFIGEPEYVGKGWGRLMLLKFMHEVAFPLFEGEEVCWIYHEPANDRALGASRAVGFKHVRYFTEEGDEKELLSVSRSEISSLASEVLAG
jgi:aminoglycoside 6'-N-acetyltransferase